MGMESYDSTPQIDFSSEEQKIEEKMHEYRNSGEQRGEEWANKIKEMFEERKAEIIKANTNFAEAEDRTEFDQAWSKMDDFVKEELQPGV